MTILVTGFTGNVGLAVGHAMMKRHIPFHAAVIDQQLLQRNSAMLFTIVTWTTPISQRFHKR